MKINSFMCNFLALERPLPNPNIYIALQNCNMIDVQYDMFNLVGLKLINNVNIIDLKWKMVYGVKEVFRFLEDLCDLADLYL